MPAIVGGGGKTDILSDPNRELGKIKITESSLVVDTVDKAMRELGIVYESIADVVKRTSSAVEVVGKTNISAGTVIMDREYVYGKKRIIQFATPYSDTKLRVYTKNEDLMQSATKLLGGDDSAVKDWDNSTYVQWMTPGGAVSETDWYKWDFGEVKTFWLYYHIASNNSYVYCKLYYSSDGSSWAKIDEASNNTKSGWKRITARYIKATYKDVGTSAGGYYARIHTLIALECSDSAAEQAVAPDAYGYGEAVLESSPDPVIAIIDTSGADYRILDLDPLASSFEEVKRCQSG